MDIKEKLRNFLDDKDRLISYPSKRKMKIVALIYLASKFESGTKYTEKEFNAIINCNVVFKDPATIRREMYNYRFIDREDDCSFYWLEKTQPTFDELGI